MIIDPLIAIIGIAFLIGWLAALRSTRPRSRAAETALHQTHLDARLHSQRYHPVGSPVWRSLQEDIEHSRDMITITRQ